MRSSLQSFTFLISRSFNSRIISQELNYLICEYWWNTIRQHEIVSINIIKKISLRHKILDCMISVLSFLWINSVVTLLLILFNFKLFGIKLKFVLWRELKHVIVVTMYHVQYYYHITSYLCKLLLIFFIWNAQFGKVILNNRYQLQFYLATCLPVRV